MPISTGVQELLAQEPALINNAWDWGGGDWETGLGAAAHMGRHDIANYLLKNGARRRSREAGLCWACISRLMQSLQLYHY